MEEPIVDRGMRREHGTHRYFRQRKLMVDWIDNRLRAPASAARGLAIVPTQE
jgi:hypothetical protein